MYKPGRINANADVLSRNPLRNEKVCEVQDTEAGTFDKTISDEIDINSDDPITDETFNLRDWEQILSIDSTVSASDFDFEVHLQDDHFNYNNPGNKNPFTCFEWVSKSFE